MTDSVPHARAFDLPGWPCPPRVRDIPNHQESWGWVLITPLNDGASGVVQDEMGYLWADGAAIPQFKLPDEAAENPGGIVFWTEHGLGVWIHPKSLGWIGNISRLDMEQDRWIPVAVALPEMPAFVKKA